jgi:hypothetical protein
MNKSINKKKPKKSSMNVHTDRIDNYAFAPREKQATVSAIKVFFTTNFC